MMDCHVVLNGVPLRVIHSKLTHCIAVCTLMDSASTDATYPSWLCCTRVANSVCRNCLVLRGRFHEVPSVWGRKQRKSNTASGLLIKSSSAASGLRWFEDNVVAYILLQFLSHVSFLLSNLCCVGRRLSVYPTESLGYCFPLLFMLNHIIGVVKYLVQVRVPNCSVEGLNIYKNMGEINIINATTPAECCCAVRACRMLSWVGCGWPGPARSSTMEAYYSSMLAVCPHCHLDGISDSLDGSQLYSAKHGLAYATSGRRGKRVATHHNGTLE